MSLLRDSPDWEERLRLLGESLSPGHWQDFRPVSETDIVRVEKSVGRTLPEDFCRFWRTFGAGQFPEPYGGGIYSPEDVIVACHGPMLMALGSHPWAPEEQQRRFYATHGAFNPAPEHLTPGVTFFQGVDLLDLLQVGTNGACCYLQVFVGAPPAPFGYAELTPEGTLDSQEPSFLDGLHALLTFRLSDEDEVVEP